GGDPAAEWYGYSVNCVGWWFRVRARGGFRLLRGVPNLGLWRGDKRLPFDGLVYVGGWPRGFAPWGKSFYCRWLLLVGLWVGKTVGGSPLGSSPRGTSGSGSGGSPVAPLPGEGKRLGTKREQAPLFFRRSPQGFLVLLSARSPRVLHAGDRRIQAVFGNQFP